MTLLHLLFCSFNPASGLCPTLPIAPAIPPSRELTRPWPLPFGITYLYLISDSGVCRLSFIKPTTHSKATSEPPAPTYPYSHRARFAPFEHGPLPRTSVSRGTGPHSSHVCFLLALWRVCCRFEVHLDDPSVRRENWFTWDQEHPSLDETLTSGCATYQAFQRYLTGADLYLVPRTRNELENVL